MSIAGAATGQPEAHSVCQALEAVSLAAALATAVISSMLLQYDVTDPAVATRPTTALDATEWAITAAMAAITLGTMAVLVGAWLWLVAQRLNVVGRALAQHTKSALAARRNRKGGEDSPDKATAAAAAAAALAPAGEGGAVFGGVNPMLRGGEGRPRPHHRVATLLAPPTPSHGADAAVLSPATPLRRPSRAARPSVVVDGDAAMRRVSSAGSRMGLSAASDRPLGSPASLDSGDSNSGGGGAGQAPRAHRGSQSPQTLSATYASRRVVTAAASRASLHGGGASLAAARPAVPTTPRVGFASTAVAMAAPGRAAASGSVLRGAPGEADAALTANPLLGGGGKDSGGGRGSRAAIV